MPQVKTHWHISEDGSITLEQVTPVYVFRQDAAAKVEIEIVLPADLARQLVKDWLRTNPK